MYTGYTSRLAKFDAELMVGWTQLRFDQSPTESSPLVRLSLGWQPTVRSSFTVAGAYQYADAAQNMLMSPGLAIDNSSNAQGASLSPGQGFNGDGGISAGDAVINAQVYQQRVLQASYAYSAERWTLAVAPLYRKLHYLNDPTFDQTGRGGTIEVGYRLRPTLTLSGFINGEKLDYQSLDRTDKTTRYGLDLRQQRTPHWSWHASLIRQHRDSNALGQSYRETEIFFGVVYRR